MSNPPAKNVEELCQRHPGMLLLFRYGNEYRFVVEAHQKEAAALDVPATFSKDVLEVTLRKLLKNKKRVAVCEPVEESPPGPVKRTLM